MAFWKMAYDCGWVSVTQLRQAVRTDGNPYGDITPEEFTSITGDEF